MEFYGRRLGYRLPDLADDGRWKYVQVADALRAVIDTGAVRQGEAMPSLATVARRYQVHEHTARQAMAVLAAAGLVRQVPRKGAFVRRTSQPAGKGTSNG